MSIGLIAGFALFLACVWLIVSPFFEVNPELDSDETGAQWRSRSGATNDQELELDYKTGKMSEADYLELKSKG